MERRCKSMRIALLGDLHGNMRAVEAVQAHIRTQAIDAIYCLGDIVGKGPRSKDTMDWAFANCAVIVQGNWDELVWRQHTAFPKALWHGEQIGAAGRKRLAALPWEHRFSFAGRRVRLVHGRPIVSEALDADDPLEMRMQLFATEDGWQPDMVGFADVHRPFYQHMRCGILFNTGSVGNPLAGQPQASYVILEGDMGDAFGPLLHTIVQLPYDREAAVRDVEQAEGMPDKDAFINEIRTGRYSR